MTNFDAFALPSYAFNITVPMRLGNWPSVPSHVCASVSYIDDNGLICHVDLRVHKVYSIDAVNHQLFFTVPCSGNFSVEINPHEEFRCHHRRGYLVLCEFLLRRVTVPGNESCAPKAKYDCSWFPKLEDSHCRAPTAAPSTTRPPTQATRRTVVKATPKATPQALVEDSEVSTIAFCAFGLAAFCFTLLFFLLRRFRSIRHAKRRDHNTDIGPRVRQPGSGNLWVQESILQNQSAASSSSLTSDMAHASSSNSQHSTMSLGFLMSDSASLSQESESLKSSRLNIPLT